ncbi:MAG: epoxyqueuosine reductase QueH [Bacteroidales bacterium]|nr:epoxyqueuosine reductase QueH [Bacteroidales bacterium]
MKKKNEIIIPEGLTEVVLHACCAPCSTAIVEWMLQHGIKPTIFYFNPNIYPQKEYEIRKEESKRHAESLGVGWIDGDYDHENWLAQIKGLENEPERGSRCQQCFRLRMMATALEAKRLGISFFTTTLASSRWKSLEQVDRAGRDAQEAVEGTTYWAQNWRKSGLQDRRNVLLKEYGFYNQLYCGCEFSMRAANAEVKSE